MKKIIICIGIVMMLLMVLCGCVERTVLEREGYLRDVRLAGVISQLITLDLENNETIYPKLNFWRENVGRDWYNELKPLIGKRLRIKYELVDNRLGEIYEVDILKGDD